MPPLTTVVKPTFPSGTDKDDLLFDSLVECMVGDIVHYGSGTLAAADITSYFDDQTTIASTLASNFEILGELGEKPGKMDSKVSSLKTRNYRVGGKRETTIELTIVGIGILQKNYLESVAFSGENQTIVLSSREADRIVILNGMRWTVEWSAEVDGLYTFVLSTEFAGATTGKIYMYKDLAVGT
jgi:hypothetical protein